MMRRWLLVSGRLRGGVVVRAGVVMTMRMGRLDSTLRRTITTRPRLTLSHRVSMSVMPAATENAVEQHHSQHRGMHKTVHGDGPSLGGFRQHRVCSSRLIDTRSIGSGISQRMQTTLGQISCHAREPLGRNGGCATKRFRAGDSGIPPHLVEPGVPNRNEHRLNLFERFDFR